MKASWRAATVFSAVWAAGAVADEQATRSFETVSSPSGFALEDLDGDGHLDLAVGSAAEGILRVHFGDGRGGFAKHVQLEVSEDRVDAVSVSSDEDGPCVLLLADRREAVLVRVERYATGHPLARAIARQRLGRQIVRLVSGDLDGDEIPDLVFAQRGKGLSWARGKGGGHFATPRSLSLTRKALGDDLVVALTLFDADRDGLLDVIALANRTRLPEVGTAWCWSNSGKGKLRPARRWEGGTFLAHAVGDTDGDGVPEVLVNDRSGPQGQGTVGLSLLTPSAEGWTARSVAGVEPGGEFRCLALGDVDADGDLDLCRVRVTRPQRGRLHVRPLQLALQLNDGAGEFDQPRQITHEFPIPRQLHLGRFEPAGEAHLLVLGSSGLREIQARGRDERMLERRVDSGRDELWVVPLAR